MLDPRTALEGYAFNALKTMLQHRSEEKHDARTKNDILKLLRSYLYDPTSIRGALASLGPLEREGLALLKARGGSLPAAALRGQLRAWHPEATAKEIFGV